MRWHQVEFPKGGWALIPVSRCVPVSRSSRSHLDYILPSFKLHAGQKQISSSANTQALGASVVKFVLKNTSNGIRAAGAIGSLSQREIPHPQLQASIGCDSALYQMVFSHMHKLVCQTLLGLWGWRWWPWDMDRIQNFATVQWIVNTIFLFFHNPFPLSIHSE